MDAPDFIPDGQMPMDTPAQSSGKPEQLASSPDFIPDDQFVADEDKYDTLGQTAKATAEGVGKGFLGSTLSHLGETKFLGVDPQEIANREEEHPVASGVGQAVGLGTGLVSGLGPEAALMGAVGKGAAGLTTAGKLTGAALETAPLASRVGSEAVKQAAEMAIMAGDDEIAKKIWTNPDETAQQAIANIGLSAALGGAGGAFVTGAVSPLWKATVGPKIESGLSSLMSRYGGSAGEVPGASIADGLASAADIDMNKYPAMKAKINGDPLAESAYSTLTNRDTTYFARETGRQAKELTNEVGEKMANNIGHDANYVRDLEPNVDNYTVGTQLAKDIHNDIAPAIEPINKAYDTINDRFEKTPFTSDNMKVTADDVSKHALANNWHKAVDDKNIKFMEKVLKKLPEQENAADLKDMISNLRKDNPWGSENYHAAQDVSKILSSAQERAVMEGMAAEGKGAELLAHYADLKKQYAAHMGMIDSLNDHIGVGKYYGPESFLTALKEKATTNPEGILRALSGKGKANALNVLQQFPEALAKVRQFHVDELLNSARGIEDTINPKKFSEKFGKLSPQIKDLIADKEAQTRIDSLGKLIDKTYDVSHDSTNSARVADKLSHGMPSPLTMVLGLVGGHGLDALMSHFGGLGLKEGSDAMRYGLLKFLGSEAPVNAAGFKSMVQMIDHTIKGESNLNKAVSSVFKGGSTSAITMPTASDLAKLDKLVAKQDTEPNHLQDKIINSQTGHYLPQHQLSATVASTQALAYLHSIKPQPTPLGPLDKPISPSKAQEARYNRALMIAENPNVVIQHIKDGTLQVTDVKDLNSLYPAVYSNMQKKIMEQVVNIHHDEAQIPYSTRLSIGLFMGQPMDASMQPQSILAAQPKPQQPSPQQQKPGTQKAGSAIKKASNGYKTANQTAEADRADRD